MKKILIATLSSVTLFSLFAQNLSVVITDDGKFDEKGLKLATRQKADFAFEKLGGRMAAIWSQPYVLVDNAKAVKLRKAEEYGTKEYALDIEYFDAEGAKGAVLVKYDSMDEVGAPFKHARGAWKVAGNLVFSGSGTWKKATLALPWARFDRKALNGFDFRFDPDKLMMRGKPFEEWGIGSVRLFTRAKTPETIDPKTLTVLENDALRLEFDGYRVRRLFDKKRKLPVLDAPSIAPGILELGCKKPGLFAPTKFNLFKAKSKPPVLVGNKSEPIMKLEFKLENGLVAKPQVKLTETGHLEWTLALECPPDVEVWEIDYPRVWGVKLGGDPTDDFCYNGGDWRQVWTGAYLRSPDCKGSMTRFQMMWDEQMALYLGIEDPDQNDWWFFISMDGCGGAQMGARQHIRAKASTVWTGNGTVWRMAVTDGGTWHSAAAIARAYNRKSLYSPDVHPFVKWLVDEWISTSGDNAPWIGWDVTNKGDCDSYSERSFGTNDAWFADIPLVAGNRQMIDGPCAAYCGMHPYPSLPWGSVREFREKLSLSRSLGNFYTPYFNFNLYAPGYIRHKRIGAFPKSRMPKDEWLPDEDWYKAVAARDWNGEVNLSLLDKWFDEYPMCILSPTWRIWQLDWMKRYAAWGADGMYLDQLNAVYGNTALWPGYEDSYGSWLKASRDTVRILKDETRKINPYVIYSGELANEIIAQELDLSMTSGVIDHHEIFRFANPWAIVIDGKWNGARVESKFRFNWQSGARFEQGMAKYRDYVSLRKAVKSILYDAQFRDGEGLICIRDGQVVPERYPLNGFGQLRYPLNDGLTAKWFVFNEGEQRGAVVNVINVTDEKKTDEWGNVSIVSSTVGSNAVVRVPSGEIGGIKAAYAFTLTGGVEKLTIERLKESKGEYIQFEVPKCEASSIILSNDKMRPLVAWDHDPVLTGGAKGRVFLKVTNVNDQPMEAKVSLRLPKGWAQGKVEVKGESLGRTVRLLPGETKEIVAEYTVAKDAKKGRYDIWADVTGAIRQSSVAFSAYAYAVVSDSLLMDLRGHCGDYHVWLRNLSDKPLKGNVSVRSLLGGLTVKDADTVVTVPAHGVVRVPVAVDGIGNLTDNGEIEATWTMGVWPLRKKISRVKAVKPLMPNPGFESDSAGDGKPDYWMCRAYTDWAYESMNLSTESHSGKYALELKPYVRNQRYTMAAPTIFDAEIGKTYKFTLWTKSESPDAHVDIRGKMFRIPKSVGWTKVEGVVAVKDLRGLHFGIYCGSGRLLVDDITVEEVDLSLKEEFKE